MENVGPITSESDKTQAVSAKQVVQEIMSNQGNVFVFVSVKTFKFSKVISLICSPLNNKIGNSSGWPINDIYLQTSINAILELNPVAWLL